jgi:hypothetical protein
MRFNIKSKPKSGDTKVEIRFAFLPKRINDTTIVWLESYIASLEYKPFIHKGWKFGCRWQVIHLGFH